MIKDRYSKILEISRKLVSICKFPNKYLIKNFDYSRNILYKMAGYNCNLDGVLRHIELNTIKSKIFSIPILGKMSFEYLYNKKYKFEVSLQKNILEKSFTNNKKYNHIFFATTDTYLKAFFSPIEDIKDKSSILIILPYNAINWSNYEKICRYKIVFIEEILPALFFDEIEYVSKNIENTYIKNAHKLHNLNYKGINLYNNYSFIWLDFMKHLFTFQVVFSYYLNDFLKHVSKPLITNCYVARDRKAIENSFIQISNLLNLNTNLIVHGMMSNNIEMNLWINGSFSNIDNIYVWGEHDEKIVLKTQQLIEEKLPCIIKGKYLPFEKVQNKRNEYILFVMQPEINNYIKYIWLYSNYYKEKVKVRFHPSQKKLVKMYKILETKYFYIDDLSKPLSNTLENAKLVVGYYSTALLESMFNSIPTLFLNTKSNKNIFLNETSLTKEEKETISIKSIKDIQKKLQILEKILSINKKITREFLC